MAELALGLLLYNEDAHTDLTKEFIIVKDIWLF